MNKRTSLYASRFLFVLCALSIAFSPQSACAFALSDSVKSAALHMFSSYERPLYFAAGFLAGIATYFLATRYAKRVTLSRIRKISENAHSILESISSFRDVLTPLNADSNSTCVLNAKRAEKDLTCTILLLVMLRSVNIVLIWMKILNR